MESLKKPKQNRQKQKLGAEKAENYCRRITPTLAERVPSDMPKTRRLVDRIENVSRGLGEAALNSPVIVRQRTGRQ